MCSIDLCKAAVRSSPPLFTTTALWYLAFAARGVPRTLNVYCDNALINGFGHRARRITLRIAREAARSLRVKPAAAAETARPPRADWPR